MINYKICIFCKVETSSSLSVEHIIPESLGNKEIVLPRGMVCDKCNNYFAVKVEKPLLESVFFKDLRFRLDIESKKGKVPSGTGYAGGNIIEVNKTHYGIEVLFPDKKSALRSSMMFMSAPNNLPTQNDNLLSRFICKICYEYLFLKFIDIDGAYDFLLESDGLSELSNYARYGTGAFWSYHVRRIYDENQLFSDYKEGIENYECLHELDIISSNDGQELKFIVLVLNGTELVIDPSSRSISKYTTWLFENGQRIPTERYYQKRTYIKNPSSIRPGSTIGLYYK